MSFHELEELLTPSAGIRGDVVRHPVVVIDDNASMLESLELLLGHQYKLTLCSSAQDGVDAVDEDICAVVLDVRMAKRDGFWACDEIRKKAPLIPVIFYSAYQDAKNPYDIINEHRPFGYVRKDEDPRQLLDTLAEAVKHQSLIVSNRKLIESLKKLQPK